MRKRTWFCRVGCAGLALLLAAAAPSAAGFNDVVQIVCDEDNFITAGCDLTHDGLKFANAVGVSADDKHVYICSSQADPGSDPSPQKETLSAYSRAADGSLTLVDQEIEDSGGVTTLASCRGVAVSPDGKHVYTAALIDRAVTWFQRTAATGVLSFTAGDSVIGPGGMGDSLAGANALVVSPDNEHVYVAGRSADAVTAFSRDATSGDLTKIAEYFDGVALVDGLDTPEGIAISPDGKHLYVASEGDNAVAVFARDTNSVSVTFGELTFVEVEKDGVGGVDGLAKASRVVLDPSGANVYVGGERGGSAGDWFAVFSRNAVTGALTFLQSFSDSAITTPINCGGVGPTNAGLVVSPNGLFVAVAQPFFAALATFSRAADGTLTFVESICDDLFVDGDDIGSIVEIAASADGKNLYALGGPFSLHSVVDYECDSASVDLVLSIASVFMTVTETACRSVTMGPDYEVQSAGDLTVTAPRITLSDDVELGGVVTLVNAVP